MHDPLTDSHDHITRAVETLITGTDWQNMLTVAARFTSYSPTNILMIHSQRPDATRVGGYQLWKSLGRQVRAGERGIRIYAPTHRRTTAAGQTVADIDPTGDASVRVLTGFRLVSVFDISQTDGPDLPDVTPTLLTDDTPAGHDAQR